MLISSPRADQLLKIKMYSVFGRVPGHGEDELQALRASSAGSLVLPQPVTSFWEDFLSFTPGSLSPVCCMAVSQRTQSVLLYTTVLLLLFLPSQTGER